MNLKHSGWAQFVLIHTIAIGAPVCLMVGGGAWGLGLQSIIEMAVALGFGLTATMIIVETLIAMRRRRAPGVQGKVRRSSRMLTVILVAYLPNEQEVIIESALAVLRGLDWPEEQLQLIVAYNTPDDLPVERELRALANRHEALEVLRVHGSTSKAENLIAAIDHARGHVTAVVDSDHRLDPQAANRAMRWFDEGYDVVQGRCVVRNPTQSFVSGVVSIEFEQIYGLAHAGRSLLVDTAIFGGANGWWRTSVLQRLGFDKTMLTEDIDSSIRALLAGYRIVHDRSVMSTELAPTDWRSWWKQRTRWAQGWFQVTMRHQGAILRSPQLSIPLKAYWTLLLTWRELFPLLALQVTTLLLADVLRTGRVEVQFDPLAGFATVLTLASGVIAAIGTWRLATPETREAHGPLRFAAFGLLAAPYTMLRNTVALVALAREAVGDHRWVVTARKPALATAVVALATVGLAASPAPNSAVAAEVSERAGQLDLVAAGAQPVTLSAAAPVATFNLATPGTWTSVGGTLTLRLSGAEQLAPSSRIAVAVNGQQVAAGTVEPGDKVIEVPLSQVEVPDHTLFVQVSTQLRTMLSDCPPPGDPTATAQLLPGSRLDVTPAVRSEIGLDALPGALVDARGTAPSKVAVRFAKAPSGDAIRAAAVATGAIAAERGYPGVKVRIVGAGRVPTVVIDERPGPSELSVAIERGRPTLTIAGEGEALSDAALMLTGDQLSHTRASRLSDPHGTPAPREPFRTVIPLDGAEQSSAGVANAQTSFTIPGRYEVQRGARLRFTGSVQSPAGTRTGITINGRVLASRRSRSTEFPVKVDTLLADRGPSYLLGDLRPGENTIGVRAVANAATGACTLDNTITSTIDPAGTVLLRARTRPISEASLATWPFPMDGQANWASSTVVIPADPSRFEIASTIAVLAEAQRITGEPALPSVDVGGAARSTSGPMLVLARAGAVPAGLASQVTGGTPDGTLSVIDAGRGTVLAVGARALLPLARAYAANDLPALTVDVDRAGTTHVRTPVTAVATAVPARETQVRWPLLVLGGSITVMFLLLFRGTLRRNRAGRSDGIHHGHAAS